MAPKDNVMFIESYIGSQIYPIIQAFEIYTGIYSSDAS
jgi:hypothetical protein